MPPWWTYLLPVGLEIVKEVIGLFKDGAKKVKKRAVEKQQEARAPK